jgi:hypothetical protein
MMCLPDLQLSTSSTTLLLQSSRRLRCCTGCATSSAAAWPPWAMAQQRRRAPTRTCGAASSSGLVGVHRGGILHSVLVKRACCLLLEQRGLCAYVPMCLCAYVPMCLCVVMQVAAHQHNACLPACTTWLHYALPSLETSQAYTAQQYLQSTMLQQHLSSSNTPPSQLLHT